MLSNNLISTLKNVVLMKKLIILFLFIAGLLPSVLATDYFVVKMGNELTVYQADDFGESNYWGRKVVIQKDEYIIPANYDSYFSELKIPEAEWKVFSKSQNGIYDTRLEKLREEKAELRVNYNELFAENTRLIKYKNFLEIVIVVLGLVIIFLGLKILPKKFKKKFEGAMM